MSAIFNSISGTELTAAGYLIGLAVAGLCGLIAAFAASFKSSASKSFVVSLVLLPMIIDTVIVMVNGNIGTGVAVMGAFSLVRFRSVPGKAKDIASIFLAMTAGLACAAGYVGIAVVFTVIVSAVMVLLAWLPVGGRRALELHITIPETLNFYDAFDDLFEEFTMNHRIIKVKTSNMGSLFKLSYEIVLKDASTEKEFIDDLRTRNGNLEISVSEHQTQSTDQL